ncbi:extracellular solute-binding protein [Paenibacillus sp. J5C_2022]|uniref:extracellular solute-binding protein n=1 Tax=Paenibacillus sp. J5C2022 TaxID=2977129 RepID=UPI0021D01066|nr:extracellular solute-binding protein [Paenibacillus sp. J5C2022]MCU6712649.1 extracellular solute-binding protein [Paenibacillus sp. J5C2022]
MPRSRLVFFIVIAVLAIAVLTLQRDRAPVADNEAASLPPSDHMDISVAFWDIGNAFEPKDAVLRHVERRFNMTIEPVQITMSDYNQKLLMWATSDKLPDVFAHSIASDSPGIYNEWIKHGLIRPLPEDLSPYPHVDNIAQIPDIRLLKKDNKLYMLPRIGYPTNRLWMLERVVFVRSDWMKDALIRDIRNFQEFSNMLITFGNRKSSDANHETVGLTAAGMSYLSWALSPTFPQFAAGQWVLEDAQWIPFYASRKMDDVVIQLRQLYSEGALDQEFYYMKEDDAVTKFAQGLAGALVYRATPNSLRELEDRWSQYQADTSFHDAVDILHLWPDEEGNRHYYVAQTYWSESFFNARVSDGKMDRILRLYDYLLSPAGQRLTSYGLEGIDYEMDGDRIVITRPIDEATGRPVPLHDTYPSVPILRSLASWGKETYFRLNESNKMNLGENNIRKSLAEMEWQFKHAVATPAYHKINSLSTPAKDKISTLINPLEDLIKVTIGDGDPLQLWHSYLEQYRAMGLNDAIAEVNEALRQR